MRAILAQLDPAPGDRAANAARVVGLLEEHPGADLAVLPELYLDGYDPGRAASDASPAEAVVELLGAAAARHRTAIAVGFLERRPDGGVANAVALLDAGGALAGVYRKTHLFGAGERGAFAAGDDLLVAELDGRAVAPLVCFDVEFPEPARACARAGAEVLVTVAANMAPYAPDHRLAVRARALDNRLPHLYVNRAGSEDGHAFVGGTCVVGPDGRVLASVDDGDLTGEAPEAVLVHDVAVATPTGEDVDYLGQVRSDLPVRDARG